MNSAQAGAMPAVLVLLATHNGARWLDEQLQSLYAQQDVRVSVLASDDASRDDTEAVLHRWARTHALSVLPPALEPFGSAHRNFMRLIRDAALGDARFIALCDQDDIWLPGKLARAIERLGQTAADAYSSDVVAFWPDGTRRRVVKSQAQRSLDHLFGSPGPGCTFVFPRHVFERVQQWITAHFDRLQHLWVHDWLLYAFVRSKGMTWCIDDRTNMLYRQHGHNEIGANAGWRAAAHRLSQVRDGRYRRDVLAIAAAVGDASPAMAALKRLKAVDRLWLVLHVRHFRRRALECLFLALFFVLMPRERPT